MWETGFLPIFVKSFQKKIKEENRCITRPEQLFLPLTNVMLSEKTELFGMSRNPPDLKKVMTPERVASFQAYSQAHSQAHSKGCKIKLLFSTERVDPPILRALFSLADKNKVVEQGKKMQNGEVVNAIQGWESERRPALHTAMRDFFRETKRAPSVELAVNLAKKEVDKLLHFLPTVLPFTHLVQIGIGGSSLGPEAIYLALKAFSISCRQVHFLSNVDPDEMSKTLKQIELSKTLFIVVSKSGTTLETLTNESLIRKELEKANLKPKDHFVSITEKGSPADDPSRYRASFYIWDYIGGRYSTTSVVGGLLLSLTIGMNQYLDFLRGAYAMDQEALCDDPQKNLPLLGALLNLWNRNFLGFPTVAIIPYSQALSRFPAHLQQLFMESNGKEIDRDGRPTSSETSPIVWGEVGTNGQHSFFQLLHQGTTPVPVEFIGFAKSQYGNDSLIEGSYSQEKLLSNLFAQAISLAQGKEDQNPNKNFSGNRPSHILLAEQLNPFTMGALLSYYEHKAVFLGFLWNINSFDQEGVQLGKKVASRMIQTFVEVRNGGSADYLLGKAYLDHLNF